MFRLLLLSTVTASFRGFSVATAATMALRSVDFEVFGRVQGVFFRKFTKEEAEKLGLKGWCMNTSKGTVQGQLEGPLDNVENMMRWLQTTGSPKSHIDKAVFKNEKDITNYTFNDFSIRRDS